MVKNEPNYETNQVRWSKMQLTSYKCPFNCGKSFLSVLDFLAHLRDHKETNKPVYLMMDDDRSLRIHDTMNMLWTSKLNDMPRSTKQHYERIKDMIGI